MSEEIDLRPYVQLLVKRWQWIKGGVFMAVLIAIVAGYLAPKKYQAEAMMAIVRSRTDVTFDARIRTLSEEELSGRIDDTRARQEGLVALVASNDVARQVLAEIGPQLKANERNQAALLAMVAANSRGNLIVITVRHSDPEVAGLVANQWALAYEGHVNGLYGGNRGNNVEVVALQARSARSAYEAAQNEIEKFIADNRIAALQGEVEAQQALLNSYQAALSAVQTSPIDLQVNNSNQLLAGYYEDLQQVERWLTAARALRNQVAADTGSSAADLGNALALVSLQNQVFGRVSPLELQVNLDLAAVEKVRPIDVDALINVLEIRRAAAQAQINTLTAGLATAELAELAVEPDHPLNRRIAELNVELLALYGMLEAQQTRQRELEQARDLAWETYQVLVEKQIEEEIAAGTTGTEVRLASSAVVPDRPVGARTSQNAMIAGALGLALAAFLVFAEGWWAGETGRPQWQVATYGKNNYPRRPTVRYSPGEEMQSAQPFVKDP